MVVNALNEHIDVGWEYGEQESNQAVTSLHAEPRDQDSNAPQYLADSADIDKCRWEWQERGHNTHEKAGLGKMQNAGGDKQQPHQNTTNGLESNHPQNMRLNARANQFMI